MKVNSVPKMMYAIIRRIVLTTVAVIALQACDSKSVKITNEASVNEPDAVNTGDPNAAPIFGAASPDVSVSGSWGDVLPWPQVPVSMAHLPDGKILTYSGSERRTWPSTEKTYSSTWDPATGQFSEHLAIGHNMFCGTLSLTAEGDVFVAGGRNQGNSPWTSLFNAETDSWTQIENMASGGRWYPTTLSLANGEIMTAMGSATNVRNPDLWNPQEGWRVLNGVDFKSMRTLDAGPTSRGWFPLLNLAPNGNVFHYWAKSENHFVNTFGNGSSEVSGADVQTIDHPGGVHLSYDVGKLMVTGANQGLRDEAASTRAFTVDLNKASPTITNIASMEHARHFHQLIPLPTGEVLVVGGNTGPNFSDAGSVMQPEIWNPETNTWRGVANMAVPRNYHSTALLLPDGRVLAAGGGYASGNSAASYTHQDGEVYSPPYLFNSNQQLAARPTITGGVQVADVGSKFSVNVDHAVSYFTLIKMSATTHATNTASRMYKPDFTNAGAGNFEITLHPNPNVLIPGYWMLFAVNEAGVPSVAKTFKVTAVDVRLKNLAPAGTVTQSSVWADDPRYGTSHSIDGDLNGASFSLTKTEVDSWWQLDLGVVADLKTIRLWNRTDLANAAAANQHFVNARVFVSDTPFQSNSIDGILAQAGVTELPINGLPRVQVDLQPNRSGRYVRMQYEGRSHVWLAEMQVFGYDTGAPLTEEVNIARDGTASQSSTYNFAYVASNAINGVKTGRSNAGSMSHTLNEANAWWELDLGQVAGVDKLKIYNRTDCCTNRTSDFYIFASENPFTSKNLNATLNQSGVSSWHFPNGITQAKTEYPIGENVRYLRVQLANSNFLQLAEVEAIQLVDLLSPLTVDPIVPEPKGFGDSLQFTAAAFGQGSLQYNWNFGDGTGDSGFSGDDSIHHEFAEPGRYQVSVSVRDSTGDEVRTSFTQMIHRPLTAQKPRASGGLLEHSARAEIWNVNPDNQSVSVVDSNTLSVLTEIDVAGEPVALAEAPDGRIWTVLRDVASISIINPVTGSGEQVITLPAGSQPYGIVFGANRAFVALEALGQVQAFTLDGAVAATQDVGPNPRHLSLNGVADKLYVSRFISPPLPGEDTANPIVDDGTRRYGGEVVVLNALSLAVLDTIILQHSDVPVSEHEGPGIPNYLGPMAISPDGSRGYIPSKQDNILGGQLRGNSELTFDQTVRAITSQVGLGNNKERIENRVDHDNASVASHTALDPFGVTLFSSLEGNRQVSIVDANTATELARLETGRAPQSLIVSRDGKHLYVHNFMDRTLDVFDIENIVQRGAITADKLASITLVSNEVLAANILRGKQLFYDSRDDRLAGLDYMSCVSCHADAGQDGRVWDFTALGEGLRNTITLEGRAGTGHGNLHWTGNFDEIQDFEGQIRDFAGGTGLMDDASFASVAAPMGPPKAGLSEDLDALAAYLGSLNAIPNTPHRSADGSLTADAEAGKSVFEASDCASCHSGESFTDSNTATLHDVGTIFQPASGQRLGAALSGLDTPSLAGIWQTPPYLHDGSAATIQDAISAHLNFHFTAAELSQLTAYLNQIDDNLDPIVPPPPPPPLGAGGVSNFVSSGTLVQDGRLNDWAALAEFGTDPNEGTAGASLNIQRAWLAHDASNFHIAIEHYGEFINSWGNGIFIDTDRDASTGFRGFSGELPIGVEYIIESNELLRYTGTGNDYSWELVAEVPVVQDGNSAEISLPRTLIDNPGSFHVFFQGDHSATGGTGIDYFPDSAANAAATASDRYFVYTVSANGNQPPLANPQSIGLAQNGAVDIVLSAADANGDDLTFEITDLPINGTLTGTAPNVRYQAATDFAGTDTFAFTANDGSATSDSATVTVNVAPVVAPALAAIEVDGVLGDWAAISSLGNDPIDAIGTNDAIDWREGWIAHDNSNYYIAYRLQSNVTLNWGLGVKLDTDGDRNTGFRGFSDEYPVGVDVMIEGNELFTYTGTGLNWSWAESTVISYASSGVTAEMAIPFAMLGNPSELQFFLTGDNMAVSGNTLDYYPDTVADRLASNRHFVYRLTIGEPVAYAQTLETVQSTALPVTLSGSAVGNGQLGYTIVQAPQQGTLGGTVPNLTYTPNAGFEGNDSFTFTVSEGDLVSEAAVVSIHVRTAAPQTGEWSNAVSGMVIDGRLTDWAAVVPFTGDAADVEGLATQIDWRRASMANDADNLYLSYQNDTSVGTLSYGHAIFLDTDTQAATGFRGFASELATGTEFMIEGTDLYLYTGTGTNWSWAYIATLQSAVEANEVEILIPRASIGNPSALAVFLRGDNGVFGVDIVDFYPDEAGDSAAVSSQRSFRYVMTP